MRTALVMLAMLIAANAGAWAAGRLLGPRLAAPLDGGRTLRDGARLLGDHKTWRGLIAGVATCAAVGHLLGPGWPIGAAFGALSLTGDAASSFVKRRLHAAPGVELTGLDQLPEALLPMVLLAGALDAGPGEILGAAATFLVLDVATAWCRRAA